MKYCELCRKIKSMKFPKVIIAAAAAVLAMQPDTAWAQEKAEKNEDKASPVNIHGTIRSKYEYQTEEGEAKRDDENYFYVSCWEYQGSDDVAPVLYKEPLVYEAIKVQTRNYKS